MMRRRSLLLAALALPALVRTAYAQPA